MDFKRTVMGDTDSKYLDMLNNKTASPFKSAMSISEQSSYKLKKNAYLRRLENERIAFNNAINKVKKTRDERIRVENEHNATVKRDKKRMGFCYGVLISTFVLVVVFVFAVMQSSDVPRFLDVAMHELSFDHFFSMFNASSLGNCGWEVGILSIILGGLTWLGLLILAIVKKKNEDKLGWLIGLLIGGLFISGASIMLPIVIMRLLLSLLALAMKYLVSPFGVLLLGVVALVLLIVKCRSMELKQYRVKCICGMIVLFFVILIHWSLGNQFAISANQSYQSSDGTSEYKARTVEAGESYLAHIKEDGGRYYFRFSPEESGEYTIRSLDEQRTQVTVYSTYDDMRASDSSSNDGFTLTKYLEANEVYYICVSYVGDYHGHFTVDVLRK